VLDAPADPVTKFDDDLKNSVNNMFETMCGAGRRSAAVQVGVPKRLFVMDCSGAKTQRQRIVMINPKLSLRRRRMATKGCLSFPGIFFWRAAKSARGCPPMINGRNSN
jgi:peptide deformylase